MKLNELRENPQNPSKCTDEQLKRLAGKLKRVPLGLTAMRIAYVTDDKDGGKMVISGNKRLRVLKEAYGEDAELPDEYFQDVTSMTEAERHEFIVDANTSDGTWDIDKLLEQYDVGMLNTLIGAEEVFKLTEKQRMAQLQDVKDENATPDVDENSDSTVGTIYALGRHKLIVGDATKQDTIDKLFEDKKADLVITDPPYNINVVSHGQVSMKIMNDNMSNEDYQKFMDCTMKNIEYVLKDGGVFYVWHGDGGPEAEVELALRKTKLYQSQPLIWVKSCASFSLGRMDYNKRHENCKFGWKLGKVHYFCKDFSLNSIIQDDTPDFDKMKKDEAVELLKRIYTEDIQQSILHEKKPSKSTLHPTMKPVNLIKRLIYNSSIEGDIIADLFLGSGTTIIACEDTNRICYGVEYDVHYADVIRKRYAEYVHGKGCDWKTLTPPINSSIIENL